jgi:hypothetical protein
MPNAIQRLEFFNAIIAEIAGVGFQRSNQSADYFSSFFFLW